MSMLGAHKIAVTGATGFVGRNLVNAFRLHNWDIVPLGRNDFKQDSGAMARKMNSADIVVNLAGAPVIAKWTEEYKKVMYESRVNVTRRLVESFSMMEKRPELFISTSAIGYYASGGTHTEDDNIPADDFLGNLTKDWESEALGARDLGIRTVIFRFGIVLGKDGGALKQMLLPFKLGLGGTIGDGEQQFSWIHINDLVRTFESAITENDFEGIYNLTSPESATNRGLTHALGSALRRPTFLRVPMFVLKLRFGEGAQVLTGGQKVIPKRLLDRGFEFRFRDINTAVRDCVS